MVERYWGWEVDREAPHLACHLAPRRADYERVFTGVNLKTDIISGTLFNSSGTLFWAPETIDSSGTLFRQFDPNLLATLYLTPTGDPSNPVHSFQSTYSTTVLNPSEMASFYFCPLCFFKCALKWPAEAKNSKIGIAFVWLFSVVCFKMYLQIAWLRRGVVTLVAFVWLSSAIQFQMCSQMLCPRRGNATLFAFRWRNVKQMQPMWLCLFSIRPFEDTFDNAQWRKAKQM